MIPKVVHYIWLGNGEKSKIGNICINSWYDNLTDYEIKEWNETNLDIDKIAEENRFFAECRKRKLWAFMADYLRLKILYENGGIYFDTDVQVLHPLDKLLNDKFFVGYEYDYKHDLQIGTGVIACEKGNPIIRKCLDFYDKQIWEVKFYTIPRVMSFVLKGYPEATIYPPHYFAPFAFNDKFSRSEVKLDTYTIHWFEGTWSEKLQIRTFMKTKHIKNPVKRKCFQFLQVVKYYYESLKNRKHKS